MLEFRFGITQVSYYLILVIKLKKIRVEKHVNLNLNQMSELASSASPKNSGLSTKLAQLKLSSYTLLLLSLSAVSCAVLSSCSTSTASAADNNSNLSTSLTLEKAATVPVLDGKATQTGIYVHNNTGQTISGIQYASVLTNAGAGQHAGSLQLSSSNCASIAANSSCLLSFSTPSLSLGQSGSSLIDASYNGQHSKQLINYRYYSSNDYSGVNFSDGSTSLYGTNDYATVYAFVGKGQSQTKVGFNTSNSSLAVSSGLTNGSVDIASNQIIALEIKSNQDVTSNLVSLTPYTVTTFKQLANSLQIANLQNQNLQVTISPTQQANLLMSDSPILNATGESSATITLINNGNQTASNITLSSADSAKVSITAASSNPCTSGGSLAAGASCNYKLSLVDLYNNGQSSLNLAYNNSLTSVNTSQSVYYYNNLAAPMISIVPASSSFTEGINTANTLVFNVQNIGNAPLSNLSVSLSKTLTQATLSQTNSCGAQINAKASCTITATVTANANIDSGIFYAKLNGNFSNGVTTNAYSFVSKPVSASITDSTIATITSTTPQNGATNVTPSTSVALSFSKAMRPITLNSTNIQLQKVSDSSSIPLTFQGVSNGNQTVTFTQTSGKLSDLTNYKIVINPSALIDYNGNSMGASSSQIAASFTTGDSVAPTLVTVNPSNGATNQSKTPTINITFSEPMNTANLTTSNIKLTTESGTLVAGTSIVVSNSNQTATVNLNSLPLSDTTSYKLVLNQTQLTDNSGNQLGNNPDYVATTFTTGDFTAPTLSSTIPLNGATGVTVESAISLTFSESMDTTTLTTTSVKLQKASNNSEVTLNAPSFSNANKTATFQPASSLTAGESYNIVINPSVIKDVAGNALGVATSQTVSNFSVISYPKFAYITDVDSGFNFGGVSKCSVNASTGELSACSFTKIDTQGYRFDAVALWHNNLYTIGFSTDGSYFQCLLNLQNGDISACVAYMSGSFNGFGLVVYKNWAYISLFDTDKIMRCQINQSSGNWENCQDVLTSGLNNPSQIYVQESSLYITNYGWQTPGTYTYVSRCAIDSVSGDLNNCGDIGGFTIINNSNEISGVAVKGTHVFLAHFGGGSGTKISSCLIAGGLMSNCTDYPGFNAPGSLEIFGDYLYITEPNTPSVQKFKINNVTGVLSECATTGSGFYYPSGIVFSSNE